MSSKSTSAARMNPFLHSSSNDASGDDLWNKYLDVVEEEDKSSIERWQGSTSGLLTFTGIFAVIVATFLLKSFEQLQPDTAAQTVFVGNQTVYLLAQLVSVNNPAFTLPDPDISQNPFDFQAPTTAVVLNSLWFLSLVISLVCTLLATLVQEWSRDFQRTSQHRFSDSTVKEAAFNHIYQRMGVDRFGLDYMTSIIVGFIHVAVALFLIGLAIFLFPVHHVPAGVVIVSSAIAAAFYLVASVIPVFAHDCPYHTWLTPVFSSLCWTGYTLAFLMWNLAHKSRRWRNGDQRINPSIVWALIKGVSKYIYELFDPEVDFVFMKDLPYDLKRNPLVMRWLRGRSTDWNSFMNGSRLAFVWQRMSGYLLLGPKDDKDAIGALLDHLPRQISDSDMKPDVSAFIVHLRRREKFMRPLVHRMCEVHSTATAVGSLKLLQVLIDADSPDAALYDFLGGHWRVLDDTIARHFPRILERIDIIHIGALRGIRGGSMPPETRGNVTARSCDLSVVIGVTKLRRTILRKRNEMLCSAGGADTTDAEKWTPPSHIIDKIRPLDKMLLCLEEVSDFCMLPLHQQDVSGGDPSEAQPFLTTTGSPASLRKTRKIERDLDSYNLTMSRILLARNTLTLVAYLICFELQIVTLARQSQGPYTEIANRDIGSEHNETTYERNLSHLHDWLEKHRVVTQRELLDTSDMQLSAVFTYLCESSINGLHLHAIEEEGRVTSFEVAEEDTTRMSMKVIRDLLSSLVQQVRYRRPHPPSTPPDQMYPAGTDQVPEALKIVHAHFSDACTSAEHTGLSRVPRSYIA